MLALQTRLADDKMEKQKMFLDCQTEEKKTTMYMFYSVSLNVLKFSNEFDLESTMEIMFQLKSHFVGEHHTYDFNELN